jgi:hypothetical protein
VEVPVEVIKYIDKPRKVEDVAIELDKPPKVIVKVVAPKLGPLERENFVYMVDIMND